ncbi:unnamed protein product, partial [Anisakis simplex]|uniref:Uncharacterized protein n=1 Tax=Anisakis simplex TaxID=6269 RepID=A0A0M3J4R9_ANISI
MLTRNRTDYDHQQLKLRANSEMEEHQDDEEMMIVEGDVKRDSCIAFIKRQLQPKFMRCLRRMKAMNRLRLTETTYQLLFSYERRIETEVRSIYGDEANPELMKGFYRAAGTMGCDSFVESNPE